MVWILFSVSSITIDNWEHEFPTSLPWEGLHGQQAEDGKAAAVCWHLTDYRRDEATAGTARGPR